MDISPPETSRPVSLLDSLGSPDRDDGVACRILRRKSERDDGQRPAGIDVGGEVVSIKGCDDFVVTSKYGGRPSRRRDISRGAGSCASIPTLLSQDCLLILRKL